MVYACTRAWRGSGSRFLGDRATLEPSAPCLPATGHGICGCRLGLVQRRRLGVLGGSTATRRSGIPSWSALESRRLAVCPDPATEPGGRGRGGFRGRYAPSFHPRRIRKLGIGSWLVLGWDRADDRRVVGTVGRVCALGVDRPMVGWSRRSTSRSVTLQVGMESIGSGRSGDGPWRLDRELFLDHPTGLSERISRPSPVEGRRPRSPLLVSCSPDD